MVFRPNTVLKQQHFDTRNAGSRERDHEVHCVRILSRNFRSNLGPFAKSNKPNFRELLSGHHRLDNSTQIINQLWKRVILVVTGRA